MVKITILYHPPTDVEAFNEHYLGVHVPLARKMPGILRSEVTFIGPGPDGSDPEYHLMYEMVFEDRDALLAALGSPEGREAAADTPNLPIAQRPIILVGEVQD